MGNARLIYEQIKDLDYINSNMVGKEFENTWLDCKKKSRPDKENIDDSDKKNLAKAISGFANTSGGVLIFGLDARKIGGIDKIEAIDPIKGISKVESQLRECETRIVERNVPGMEYSIIFTKKSEDEGIIKIFIPVGGMPPYRSLKDNKFYIRAGDSFCPIDLPQIESLVLRRIKPDLVQEILIKPVPGYEIKENLSFAINIRVKNTGEVIAKHVLFQLRIGTDYARFYNIVNSTLPGLKAVEYEEEKQIVYHKALDRVIHPLEEVLLQPIQIKFPSDESTPHFFVKLVLFAENMRRRIYTVNIKRQDLCSISGGKSLYKLKEDSEFSIQYE